MNSFSICSANIQRTADTTQLLTRIVGEKIVVVPPLADSVVEGRILEWRKNVGDQIAVDDVVLTLETDKTSIDLPAKESGVLLDLFGLNVGDTVRVGQNLYKLKLGAVTKSAPKPAAAAPKESKEVPKESPKEAPKEVAKPKKEESKPATSAPAMGVTRSERREKMRMIRERIAQRLKASQNTYAMLTTFQECDMGAIMALRDKYKDDFAKRHGVKLGFMSAFVKAAAIALTEWPVVNAVIDGDHIVYRDYVDISVAVATPNGLVVPVIRNAHLLSFAQIEKTLGELAVKAREFKIKVEDTTGGTFTISNGGVYGSLFGTPIINPPQSAILGMHAINKRPVVITDKDGHDQIAIRPIMYLALTYDHRLVDGLEAVSFLRRIKFLIEDPQRLLLDV